MCVVVVVVVVVVVMWGWRRLMWLCGCGRGCGRILVVSVQNAIKMMTYLCEVLSQSKTVNRRYGSTVCEWIQAQDTGPTPV